jgi:hypothetical protein
MNVRKSLVRLVALTVVASMPVMGMAGIASAKATKATKGSAAWCAKHPQKAICKAGGSAGTGGAGPLITITASPNALVETGASEVHAVLQVETNPSLANDSVIIQSTQLQDSCETHTIYFHSLQPGALGSPNAAFGENFIQVTLDDDGNATVLVNGTDCAPGSSVIEADLTVAPYYTGLTTLQALPPQVTAAGLTGYPNNEVETGDDAAFNGVSDVYAVFYVETAAVYAEQPVEISSAQLEARCGLGWEWLSGNGGTTAEDFTLPIVPNTGPNATTTLDDDGNAVFIFKGASCAAGDSQVIADVEAGTHPTYTFDYTIDAPAVTI